jgi:hypothetical protein
LVRAEVRLASELHVPVEQALKLHAPVELALAWVPRARPALVQRVWEQPRVPEVQALALRAWVRLPLERALAALPVLGLVHV